MDYTGIEQGSDSWRLARLGKITASKIVDILGKGKNGAELAGKKNYRAQLICERLTGQYEDTYCNSAMQRGTEMEPFARECYEFVQGVMVEQVAFVDHPTIEMAGCSPDGLCGDDGLVEIKCPNTASHIDYILGDKVPTQYVPQMLWQMACTGRKWCDFVSYDDRLPTEMQLFIKRLHRDDAMIAEMEVTVIEFNNSIEKVIADLKAIRS